MVRIANACRVPVYPVSRGKNWGYGSRVPVTGGCALLELDRLNRITEVSEELGHVTLEPGVTYQALFEELGRRNSRLTVATTGGPPDGSVLGNAIDRGVGSGPHADAFAHVCGMEVVLPTGELLRTGIGRFPSARAAAVDRWGIGPWLDGLFSQSSLGIVTRMTIWLYPAPRFYAEVSFALEDDHGLSAVVEALRTLRLEGTLVAPFRLWNDLKCIARACRYPWEEANGRTPLPDTTRRALRARQGVGAWEGLALLFASRPARMQADCDAVASTLSRVCDRVTVRRGERFGEGESHRDAAVPGCFVPSTADLATMYWRKRTPVPEDKDPHRDQCGVLWYSAVLPCVGREAEGAVGSVEAVIAEHGFETVLALRGVSERALHLVGSILFDRETKGEDRRALACHRDLSRALARRGWYPYRLGIQSMSAFAPRGVAGATLEAIEQALDPAGILAPGRYSPKRRRRVDG